MNTWTIDQGHSTIGFSVKHLVISTVKGKFTNFAETITTADDTFENAQAELTIHSNSIDTNQADRDAHLQGADMFDSEAFPEITFTSESFVKKGDEFEVVGTITDCLLYDQECRDRADYWESYLNSNNAHSVRFVNLDDLWDSLVKAIRR